MASKIKAALEAAKALVDAMETCHICHGTLSLDDISPAHCENCSWDCDEHDEPECVPTNVLHDRAKRAVSAALRELEQPEPGKRKCRFCGDPIEFLDRWSHCKACVDGMERTNGD